MSISQSNSARVRQILQVVDHMEQVVDSAKDRLEILQEVISDLRIRADATKEDIRRG